MTHLLIYLHIAAVVFSLAIVFFADKQVIAWVRGKRKTLDHDLLRRYHRLIWIGLTTLLVTGTLLLLPQIYYLLAQPLFVMKLLFAGILVVNAVLIDRLMHITVTRTFASLSKKELFPLFASGAFSMLGWICATLIAIYLF